MVAIGNFLFKYRNALFPLVFILCFFNVWPTFPDSRVEMGGMIAGIAIALLGQLVRAVTIGLAYIKRGGKDKKVYAETLVSEGIFSHCRNPLYLGNLLIIVGVGIASNSLLFVIVGLPMFFFSYAAIIAAEEDFLRGKFGPEYDGYCQRVPRLIPNLTGIGATLQSMEFHWKRLIVKEYSTAYSWMAGITILIAKNRYWESGRQLTRSEILCLGTVFAVVTLAFLIAWMLKKTKLVRAN
jgi:protein-S-isoprenylcysteine O-methyltransferase Ste14